MQFKIKTFGINNNDKLSKLQTAEVLKLFFEVLIYPYNYNEKCK